MVELVCEDGSDEGATVKIKRHSIELWGLDEEPVYFMRAILAFTGWASARDAQWEDLDDATEFLRGELLPCIDCGEQYESGLCYPTPCVQCGRSLPRRP